jgi:hypothetical protein
MHEQERILISAFNLVRAFVEQVANNSADPKTIIESSGLTVINSSGNTAVSELTLTPMGNGVVQINVPRNSGEVAFVYQYSTDAVTWTEFAMRKLATVELQNQNPATVLNIRFAPIAKIKGAFCQPKTVIVL